MIAATNLLFVALFLFALVSQVFAIERTIICEQHVTQCHPVWDPTNPGSCLPVVDKIQNYQPENGVVMASNHVKVTYDADYPLDMCYDLHNNFLGPECENHLNLRTFFDNNNEACFAPGAKQGQNKKCPLPMGSACVHSENPTCDNEYACLDGRCQHVYRQSCRVSMDIDIANPPSQCSASDVARLEVPKAQFDRPEVHILSFILPDTIFTDCSPKTLISRGWSESCINFLNPSEATNAETECVTHGNGVNFACKGFPGDSCFGQECRSGSTCVYGGCVAHPHKICQMQMDSLPIECPPNREPEHGVYFPKFALVEPAVTMTPANQYFVKISYGTVASDMLPYDCEHLADGWKGSFRAWPKNCLETMKPVTITEEQRKCLEEGAQQGASPACM